MTTANALQVNSNVKKNKENKNTFPIGSKNRQCRHVQTLEQKEKRASKNRVANSKLNDLPLLSSNN
jgi:hypothetical protein